METLRIWNIYLGLAKNENYLKLQSLVVPRNSLPEKNEAVSEIIRNNICNKCFYTKTKACL